MLQKGRAVRSALFFVSRIDEDFRCKTTFCSILVKFCSMSLRRRSKVFRPRIYRIKRIYSLVLWFLGLSTKIHLIRTICLIRSEKSIDFLAYFKKKYYFCSALMEKTAAKSLAHRRISAARSSNHSSVLYTKRILFAVNRSTKYVKMFSKLIK